jgi:rhodanese-related sulfurtransferase
MMKIRNWATAISLFFLLNIVLMAGCSPIISQNNLTQTTEISAVDANNLIGKNIGNQSFVILDVRPADDYTSRHIAGAIDINYDSTNFKKDISKLIKKKQYLIYCATGVNGAAATQMMLSLGFKNVQNISGGYAAWVQGGFITCGCPGTVIN